MDAEAVDAGWSWRRACQLPEVFDIDGDGLPDLAEPETERPGPMLDPTTSAIVPGAWPIAFTNPFLIDVDGNGWKPPG